MLMHHLAQTMLALVPELRRTDRGASLVEYALLIALIAVVCIAALFFLGDDVSQKFSDVGTSVLDT